MIRAQRIITESGHAMRNQWTIAIIVALTSVFATTVVVSISGGVFFFLPFVMVFSLNPWDVTGELEWVEFSYNSEARMTLIIWILMLIIIAVVVGLLVGTYLQYAMQTPFRGRRIGFESGFDGLREAGYDRAYGTNLRIVAGSFLWSLLLIVPGIVRYFDWSLAIFLLRDHEQLSPNEAMRLSRRMMRGRRRELFISHLLLALIPVMWLLFVGLGLILLKLLLASIDPGVNKARIVQLAFNWLAILGWLTGIPLAIYSFIRIRIADAWFYEELRSRGLDRSTMAAMVEAGELPAEHVETGA